MAVGTGYSKVASNGLVFAYDTGDTYNSYIGEPTTNLMRQSNNVTGTQYGENDEYSTCQLVKTWFPNLVTPIGTGATLLSEQNAGASYWYCLNWFGANEDGKTCLSAYIYPLNSGITNFTIGLVGDPGNSVIFNLDTGATTIGGGLSNANAFYTPVPGAPGWYRIGANIEGRGGGWVASIGLGQTGEYTPSSPFKSFYICGIQYERNIATHCTQFTQAQTTRSNTQGLLDISGRGNTVTLNTSYNSNAQITFDATDDFIDTNFPAQTIANVTMEAVVYDTRNNSGYRAIIQNNVNSDDALYIYPNNTLGFWPCGGGSLAVPANQWNHVAVTYNGSSFTYYVNGVSQTVNSSCADIMDFQFLRIGAWGAGDGERWGGQIAVAKVYNRALTTAEVKNNYFHYKTRFGLP